MQEGERRLDANGCLQANVMSTIHQKLGLEKTFEFEDSSSRYIIGSSDNLPSALVDNHVSYEIGSKTEGSKT